MEEQRTMQRYRIAKSKNVKFRTADDDAIIYMIENGI